MPITVERQLFTYAELSENAKETARHWWLSCRDTSDYDGVTEDFQRICKILGVEIKMRTASNTRGRTWQEPCIYWGLSYSQGDGASFEGRYRYAKGSRAAIRKYAPLDTKLHAIADALASIQKAHFYGLSASVRTDHRFVHSGTMGTEWCKDQRGDDAGHEAERAVLIQLRALADWLFRQLQAEEEYLSSEEAVSEAMEANGYTFTKDGKREDA